MSRRNNIDFAAKQYVDDIKNEIIEKIANNKEDQKSNIKK